MSEAKSGAAVALDPGYRFAHPGYELACPPPLRHCERSEAIHLSVMPRYGLLRFARNDVRGSRRAGKVCVEMLQPRHHFLLQQAQRIMPRLRLVLVIEAEHQERAEA